MHLVRTRPFKLPHDVEALFAGPPRPATFPFGFRDGRITDQPWLPRVDVVESERALTLRYELAGFQIEDLEVTLDDNVLTVKGTRSSAIREEAVYRLQELAEGSFSRSIRVSEGFDSDAVEAKLSAGILEIVLAKRPDVRTKTIAIEPA